MSGGTFCRGDNHAGANISTTKLMLDTPYKADKNLLWAIANKTKVSKDRNCVQYYSITQNRKVIVPNKFGRKFLTYLPLWCGIRAKNEKFLI